MTRTEWSVLVGFIAFCALYYFGVRKDLELAQRHETTTGTVIDCFVVDDARQVVYEFMVNGEPYHGDASAHTFPEHCRQPKACCIGLKVKVRYLPDDPLNNELVEGWWR